MTGLATVIVLVLRTVEEHGGTAIAVTQISMGFTVMVGVTVMVSHGTISMPLHQVGVHFAIQT